MQSPERGIILYLKSDVVGKERPVLVVSPRFLNGGSTLTGIPFYSQQLEKRKKMKTCVFFAGGEFGLDRDCVAKADEVGPYKHSEFKPTDKTETVSAERMQEVSAALCYSLGIDFTYPTSPSSSASP